MSKKFTRIVCFVLAALLVIGLISAIAGSRAYAVSQAEIDALQAQRDSIRGQKQDIQEQIDALQSEVASVIEKKAALDEQNELNRQDIELINGQIELYDKMIEEKGAEVDAAVAAEEEQYEHYCSRVRTMEETNTWSYITFVFEADSLTDFLGRLNDVMDIARNDRHVKDAYIAAREEVESVKAEYEEIQEQQEGKREELLGEKKKLEKQIEVACAMISDLEEDIENFTAVYEENEALENEVQAKIDKKVAELAAQKAAEEAARRAWEESQRKAKEAAARAAAAQTTTTTTPKTPTTPSTGTTPVASGAGYYTWPVSSCTYITSRFGYRVHPIFGTTKYHSGVDIAAGYGAAICAAAGGTVSIAEYSQSYGNYCVIYHTNGTTTLYAHMNSLPVVSVGQSVSAGQLIGYVGSTGYSTGPHCHFEIRVNGGCVDPLSYFPGIGFSYSADA